MTPEQRRQIEKSGADARLNFHRWKCTTCEDQPEYDAPQPFVAHMLTVHHIGAKARVVRQQGMHLDGTKFSETHYACRVQDSDVTYTEAVRIERTGEDAAWWQDF